MARSPRCGPVRARPAAPSRGLAAARAAASRGLDLGELGPFQRHRLPLAGQAQAGAGEGAVAPAVDLGLQGRQGAGPGRGHQGAGLAQAGLQGGQPHRVGRLAALGGVGQQPHPFALGLVVGVGVAGVVGLAGEHQAVEELAALAGGFEEQPVLGRGQPDRADMVGQPAGRDGLALDADDAAGGAGQFDAGAQADRLVVARLRLGRHGPGPAGGLARQAAAHLDQAGAAQALARRQQADGLQQVGLARAVGPEQVDAGARGRRVARSYERKSVRVRDSRAARLTGGF